MKPNFSGDYALDRPASSLSSNASAIVRATLRIEHDDPSFRCQGKFASASDTVEFSFERFTDDRASAASAQEGSRCYWDGDALVSEDRFGSGDAGMVMMWRYELSRDGKRLRAVEQIRGAGRDQDNVWEFERAEGKRDVV